MPEGLTPLLFFFEPTLPPFDGPGGNQLPQGLIAIAEHDGCKLSLLQHFVGLLRSAGPA